MEAIRLLTGMFNPDHAISILAYVNLIARDYFNDASSDFVDEQLLKIGIKLKREE
jgi:hypothetical protein